MSGKRARRYFLQLSEFERCLIIGMKTAAWSTHRVTGQVDHSKCAVRNCWEQWTWEGTHARETRSGATRPFLNGLSVAIFQQDNARPHAARVAEDIVCHFQTLPWSARSPDLFPVEHVWDQLKRQMPSCHSVHDLELAVQDLWAHLSQDNIRCLINSMPDRVAACIPVGGGPTCY
ncbi:uncharacterized protein TNCV_1535471 [Trichonephila clavipes]|uniref:Tc1-like transposase DDE domain-containing protein n=1 Tax=Trichonephila clavipes TaxID=2585209 RepID=A0A8X6R860_TRICX|nr:uncharacterized protein TNCV_1535471 [Trichonephila clavipes]